MKPATAVIDLAALQHNVKQIQAITQGAQCWVMVKANGYGHGMIPIAKTLSQIVEGFGVARLNEALALRQAGVETDILLLEGFSITDDLSILARDNLQTAVHSFEQIEAIEQAKLDTPLQVWLKIDTGMHRLGIREEDFDSALNRLMMCQNVSKPIHLMSHFASADEVDDPTTPAQLALFEKLTLDQPGLKSIAASSGCLFWSQSHFDAVRPGIAAYGISPKESQTGTDLGLKPVMTMTSNLIAVRRCLQGESVGYGGRWTAPADTLLGVVAMGYGDGYPRLAPDGTPVYVNGRIVPLVGKVSMDMLTVDLGLDAKDQVGDEVILWGEVLPVETVAQAIGTIGYELVTNITSRVELIHTSATRGISNKK